jgi:hypothetical protein
VDLVVGAGVVDNLRMDGSVCVDASDCETLFDGPLPLLGQLRTVVWRLGLVEVLKPVLALGGRPGSAGLPRGGDYGLPPHVERLVLHCSADLPRGGNYGLLPHWERLVQLSRHLHP